MDGFLGFEAISKATSSVADQAMPQINILMQAAKTLAVSFLLLNWLREYLEEKKEAMETGRSMLPISIKQLSYSILYILVILNWENLVNTLDYGLTAYVNSFNLEDNVTMNDRFAEWNKEFEEQQLIHQEEESTGVLSTISTALISIADYISFGANYIILNIVKGISWLINLIAYPVFLIERAFLLFIMKIIFPLVLALAAIEKFREKFYKWIMVYCAIFITGLFFVYVTWFCEGIFAALYNNFLSSPSGSFLGMDLGYYDRHTVELCIFTAIAFAKVKLYGSSIQLASRLFN